jgi:hypothetical protein
MLAPLAVYLLTMLIACALALLVCWACDAHTAEIDAPRSLPVVSKFPVYPLRRKTHFRLPARGRPIQSAGVSRCRWRIQREVWLQALYDAGPPRRPSGLAWRILARSGTSPSTRPNICPKRPR